MFIHSPRANSIRQSKPMCRVLSEICVFRRLLLSLSCVCEKTNSGLVTHFDLLIGRRYIEGRSKAEPASLGVAINVSLLFFAEFSPISGFAGKWLLALRHGTANALPRRLRHCMRTFVTAAEASMPQTVCSLIFPCRLVCSAFDYCTHSHLEHRLCTVTVTLEKN